MNSKSIWASLLVLSTLGPGVWAQLTNVAACPAGFSWVRASLYCSSPPPRLGGVFAVSWALTCEFSALTF